MKRIVFKLSNKRLWVGMLIYILLTILVLADISIIFNGLLWILAGLFFFLPDKNKLQKSISKIKLDKFFFIKVVFLLLPVIAVVISYDIRHFHADEYLLGYFSFEKTFSGNNFFGPIPQNADEWITQFPSLQFFFQKVIFEIFGANHFALKFSHLPYIFISSIAIYGISKKIFKSQVAGLISVSMFAVFTPLLYMQTFALPNTYSTMCVLLFVWQLIRCRDNQTIKNAILLSGTLSLCILNYEGGWLAYPIMFVYSLYLLIFTPNRKKTLINLFFTLSAIIIIISPYIAWMVKNNSLYTNRSGQTGIMFRMDKVDWGKEFTDTIRPLYQDGIGGLGGYEFDHRAYFSPANLILVIFGLIIFIIKQERKDTFLLIVIIIVGLVFSVFLLNKPLGIQRVMIIAPYFVVLITSGVYWMYRHFPLIAVSIFIFLLVLNYSDYKSVVENEHPRYDYSLYNIYQIHQNQYPDYEIKVLSYKSFSLPKILFFFDNSPLQIPVELNYVLDNPDEFIGKKTLFVILDWDKNAFDRLSKKFNEVKLLPFDDSLLVTILYTPKTVSP